MSATRNLAKKLMRALFQATLLASVRSKRRMSAIVFCPFKIHFAMILLRITARWPFMHFQRSIFVLYLVSGNKAVIGAREDEIQRIIDYFKQWLPHANHVYEDMIRREKAEAEDRQRRQLQAEIEEKERRQRVLKSIKI